MTADKKSRKVGRDNLIDTIKGIHRKRSHDDNCQITILICAHKQVNKETKIIM